MNNPEESKDPLSEVQQNTKKREFDPDHLHYYQTGGWLSDTNEKPQWKQLYKDPTKEELRCKDDEDKEYPLWMTPLFQLLAEGNVGMINKETLSEKEKEYIEKECEERGLNLIDDTAVVGKDQRIKVYRIEKEGEE